MKSSWSIKQKQESTNPETILGNFLQNRKAQSEKDAGSICSTLLLLQECRSRDYFWYETCIHSTAIKMLQALSVRNAWEEQLCMGKCEEILLAPREAGQERITILQVKNGRLTPAECRWEMTLTPRKVSASAAMGFCEAEGQNLWTALLSPRFVPPPPVSVTNLMGNSHSAESSQLEHKACKCLVSASLSIWFRKNK